ncbi:MAG: CHAT domain-containing tetratricopeptide repeat protein [Planctomycetota bacterium]
MRFLVRCAAVILLALPELQAQVLDEDLIFEDHVCVIELGDDSDVLEGVGLSREIAYEVSFEGMLFLSVMAREGLDPLLRVEDLDGELIAQDDDSGGGRDAFVRVEVEPGQSLVIRVAVKGTNPGTVRFKLFEAPETEATRAAAADARRALTQVEELRRAKRLEQARSLLQAAVETALSVPGAKTSTAIEMVLWDIGLEAYERLGALETARRSRDAIRALRECALPDDHPVLGRARGNLAETIGALGDLAGARALQEKVLEVASRTLADDHSDLQWARLSLAGTMFTLGDLAGARALWEKVLEVFSRTLPDDHPHLQRARSNLATTMHELGDLPGARALFEQVLEVCSRTLPDEHPDLQRARRAVGRVRTRAGEAAGDEVAALVRATIETLSSPKQNSAGRELDALALSQEANLSWVLSLARAVALHKLQDPRFEAIEFARAAQASRGWMLRRVAVPQALGGRVAELEAEAARLGGLVRREIFLEERSSGEKEKDTGSFFEKIHAKDRIEREISEILLGLAREQGVLFRADRESIARALEPDEAALAYWRYHLEEINPETHEIAPSVASYLAFVLAPDGGLERVELGPAAAIEDAIPAYRRAILAPVERGARALEDARTSIDETAERLRSLVLDPVLPHIEGAKRLVVTLDDVLHLVPLGALPLGGSLVGERFEIETRTSLKELTVEQPPLLHPPSLLVLGGIEYDRPALALAPAGDDTNKETSTGPPLVADAGSPGTLFRGSSEDLVRAGPWALGFSVLRETEGETRDIAALFEKAFEDGEAKARLGSDASREALEKLAPHARFLHLATHGYFAPESVASMKDERWVDEKLKLGSFTELGEQVRGFAPMELCGLALAGANLEPDASGFIAGVMTAEELSRLDLCGCELVVLSACDTNVGERRAGQGIASLQQAVYAAGAQASLTSLWKVPDQATRELTTDFYRRWWIQGKPKRQALLEAQARMRLARDELDAPRYSVKDWAGWVLVGGS